MATTDEAVINYTLYEDDEEYCGIVQVDLPSLKFMTTTVSGAGIAGEVETVLIGQMSAMEITLKHTILTKRGLALSTPEVHKWELREVQQTVDNATGKLTPTGVKHVIKAYPKQMDGGTLKPQSTSDPTTVASVLYWAEYRDGVLYMELDPLNYICYINGTDYLKSVRSALGK
ncbi:MAG: phage major tail tube protein [Clostridiales bacterium]|nr:phage major tail tube protein [Clostridiales bacterium]